MGHLRSDVQVVQEIIINYLGMITKLRKALTAENGR